jgi:hypothetical protein
MSLKRKMVGSHLASILRKGFVYLVGSSEPLTNKVTFVSLDHYQAQDLLQFFRLNVIRSISKFKTIVSYRGNPL